MVRASTTRTGIGAPSAASAAELTVPDSRAGHVHATRPLGRRRLAAGR